MKTSIKTVITLLLISLSSIFISCEDVKNNRDFELSFDLRLPQDENGFYHLTIDRNNWQTLHRVTGTIRDENRGVENFWVEWDSNLYWYLGDTLGYVVNQYVNLLLISLLHHFQIQMVIVLITVFYYFILLLQE